MQYGEVVLGDIRIDIEGVMEDHESCDDSDLPHHQAVDPGVDFNGNRAERRQKSHIDVLSEAQIDEVVAWAGTAA